MQKIKDFLGSVPSVVQQSALTVEFIPMGSQGSKPSHERFPVKTLECPQNFSTLDYFNVSCVVHCGLYFQFLHDGLCIIIFFMLNRI